MKNVNGIWFPDRDLLTNKDWNKASRMVNKGYYPDAIKRAMDYASGYNIAVDGGANVGLWSKIMAKKFKEVYAFEIDHETFACLQKNCVEENIYTFNYGLSNTKDKKLVVDGWNKKSMGAHLATDIKNKHLSGRARSKSRNNKMIVETITVDDLNLQYLDFIKLDVEGHEAQVIQGAQETLLKFKPIVMIEYKPSLNKRYGNLDPAKLLNELGASGINKIGKNKVEWIFSWK